MRVTPGERDRRANRASTGDGTALSGILKREPSTDVVLANARTHYPKCAFVARRRGRGSRSQSKAVVMGPGFRQDDDVDDARFNVSNHVMSSPALVPIHPVIPGRAKREPGIHRPTEQVVEWIPGSRFASPGMT